MYTATLPHPAPPDLLCSNCGYSLAGLPRSGHCPECAHPIAISVEHSRAQPPLEILRAVRVGCRLAAGGLLVSYAGIAAAMLADNWLLLPLSVLVGSVLWLFGADRIGKLLHRYPKSIEDPGPRGTFRASLLLMAATTGISALYFIAAIASSDLPLAPVLACTTFFYIGAGIASWLFVFYHLRNFAALVLLDKPLARWCITAASACFGPIFAIVFAIGEIPHIALPLASAPFLIGAAVLITIAHHTARTIQIAHHS